jgi:myo-inosose-2 dehydratase
MAATTENPGPVRLRDCLVGANPIIWSNDDFDDLAGDVPLDTILREMREAGFAGAELGHAFPRAAGALAEALARHRLRLVSGWHSTYLAEQPFATEAARFRNHLNLLKTLGARIAIVAECTRCIHGNRNAALSFGQSPAPALSDAEWDRLSDGLARLAEVAAEEEMLIAYHHHMGTVVQRENELERLLESVPAVRLLLDPGHLAFAGIDPVAVASRHAMRIAHVHLKSVRSDVVARVRQERWSFYRAVANGVFTVAGQGSVDFPAIFRILAAADYRGWLVVEAEEDPVKVPALPKAKGARAYVRAQTGV